jgi:predicted TIM-barrel fold metal-dependent hydrolase
MAKLRLASADSHFVEPADLWTRRIDRRFADSAPRVVKAEEGPGYFLVAPGVRFGFGFASGVNKTGKELKEHQTKGYEAAPPGGWDPVERLKDQDTDGVEAEVIYSSLGLPLFALDDPELQCASFRVYNDWIAEFASHDRKRLYPVPLISLEDVSQGVKELERCAKMGLRGAVIWADPPADKQYDDPLYDPFWDAAQELEMPLTLHIITERKRGPAQAQTTGFASILKSNMRGIQDVQRSLSIMIVGHVFDRFTRLRIVSAENDCGWVPHFMYRQDHFFHKYTSSEDKLLEMKPSDYIRRHFWATFQDDIVGPMTCRYFGEDNYMWASDFPHGDSTWPNSRKVVEQDFDGVPRSVTQKIVHSNVVKLYKMDLHNL